MGRRKSGIKSPRSVSVGSGDDDSDDENENDENENDENDGSDKNNDIEYDRRRRYDKRSNGGNADENDNSHDDSNDDSNDDDNSNGNSNGNDDGNDDENDDGDDKKNIRDDKDGSSGDHDNDDSDSEDSYNSEEVELSPESDIPGSRRFDQKNEKNMEEKEEKVRGGKDEGAEINREISLKDKKESEMTQRVDEDSEGDIEESLSESLRHSDNTENDRINSSVVSNKRIVASNERIVASNIRIANDGDHVEVEDILDRDIDVMTEGDNKLGALESLKPLSDVVGPQNSAKPVSDEDESDSSDNSEDEEESEGEESVDYKTDLPEFDGLDISDVDAYLTSYRSNVDHVLKNLLSDLTKSNQENKEIPRKLKKTMSGSKNKNRGANKGIQSKSEDLKSKIITPETSSKLVEIPNTNKDLKKSKKSVVDANTPLAEFSTNVLKYKSVLLCFIVAMLMHFSMINGFLK